jgi:hypothetical protein
MLDNHTQNSARSVNETDMYYKMYKLLLPTNTRAYRTYFDKRTRKHKWVKNYFKYNPV